MATRLVNQKQLRDLFAKADQKVSLAGVNFLIDFIEKFLQDFAESYDKDFGKIEPEDIAAGWAVWFPTDEEEEESVEVEDGAEIELDKYFPEHIVRLIEAFQIVRPDVVNWMIKMGSSLDVYISDEAKIVAKDL
jgi:hypothetical protein